MATKRESLEFCCVICLENYTEDGAHVPKILPCSHTTCESCIKDLLRNQTLVCPECRKKHRAENKEKSFPQNKYLLAHIGSKKAYAEEESQNTRKVTKEQCQEHGLEMVIYCFEDACQKPICVSCLVDHNKHDVKGIDVREKELLKKELKFKTVLETRLRLISEAEKNPVPVWTCIKPNLVSKNFPFTGGGQGSPWQKFFF